MPLEWVDDFMRDVCELDRDDPDDPDTICIDYDTLRIIAARYIVSEPENAEPGA